MSDAPPILYCANHPNVETSLRCNNCEKPICPKCAVRTPTGYRCRECVRNQQRTFDTAEWYDYPLAFVTAIVLSYFGSRIASFIGFFIIFVAPIAGVVIAEAVRFVIRRRRSKNLFLIATIAVVLGSLPTILIYLAGTLLGFGGARGLLSIVWQGLYTIIATSTTYYRLRGINIR